MKQNLSLSPAADLLEQVGWVQGMSVHPNGPFCMMGAVEETFCSMNYPLMNYPLFNALSNEITKALRLRGITVDFGYPHLWNDNHETTKEQVIEFLRSTTIEVDWHSPIPHGTPENRTTPP